MRLCPVVEEFWNYLRQSIIITSREELALERETDCADEIQSPNFTRRELKHKTEYGKLLIILYMIWINKHYELRQYFINIGSTRCVMPLYYFVSLRSSCAAFYTIMTL